MAAHAADELYGHRDGEPDRAAREAWQASLLTAALRQLEKDSRIQGDTFAIFKACVIHGDSHAAVAARFKVEENYVYQVKHRLTRRLQAEVRRLAELSGFDGAV